MAYKYTAYYYTKDGKTDSVSFTTGYDLRKADRTQKKEAYDKMFDKIWDVKRNVWQDIIEFDIYDSKGVLVTAKKRDAKNEKWEWTSLVRKKDKEWHPFGL